MSLAGRVAVVAGAGRGIGRAIALGLAGEGAEVVALARTLAEVEAVAAEIRAAGGPATARRVDVADEAEVAALAGWLASRASPPRILVNNAGLRMDHLAPGLAYPYRIPLLELPVEAWDRMIRANLRGPFLTCRLLGPLLCASGGASVVNVSAGAGITAVAGRSPYVASKFALEGLTRSLAEEWRAANVAVNALEPGVSVLTDLVKRALLRAEGAPRFARPEVLVPAALFLAAQDAGGVTGAHVNALAWLEERGLGAWERWAAR